MQEAAVNTPEMMTMSPSQPTVLAMFPRWLQDIIVEAVMNARCERATDIWYEQQPGKSVVVLRNGVQWYLNETASEIWMRVDVPVRELANEWAAGASEEKKREITVQLVDFLLIAAANCLVTLVLDTGSTKQGKTGSHPAPKST